MLQDPRQLSALGKIGFVLQNTANPNYMPQYMEQLQRQQEAAQLGQLREQEFGLRKDELEMRRADRAQRIAEQQRQQALQERTRQALGSLSPQIAEQFGIAPELAADLITTGALPAGTVLGSLQTDPMKELQIQNERLRQQQLQRQLQAQPERRIVEQDGVSYYTDTGKPVISELYRQEPKELKEVRVQGLDIIEGAVPTKDDAKLVKNSVQSKKILDKLVNEYEGLVRQYGWEPSSATEGGRLISQKKSQIDLQAKNLEDLGALQEADRAILGDMLGNPVGDVNVFGAQDIALRQVADYKNYLDERLAATLQTRGYAPQEQVVFSTVDELKETPKRLKFNPQTGRLE